MMLHSMSRLGVINYLFQNRHSIAFTVGIISETPIAMCNSDYFPGKTLIIVDHQDETSVPFRFVQAQEIILFYQSNDFIFKLPVMLFESKHHLLYKDQYLSPLLSGIFHPPSIV